MTTVSLTSVQSQAPAVQAAMTSADQAVQANASALGQPNVTQWDGIMAQFTRWYAGLEDALSSSFILTAEAEGYYEMSDGWAPSAAQLQTYTQTAQQWQTKVAQSNPLYVPPIAPPAPITPPSALPQTPTTLPTWGKWTLGGLAVTLVVVIVAKVKEIL